MTLGVTVALRWPNSFQLLVTFTIYTYTSQPFTLPLHVAITYPRVIQKQHVWSAFLHGVTPMSSKSKHMKRPQEQVQGEASTSFFADVCLFVVTAGVLLHL